MPVIRVKHEAGSYPVIVGSDVMNRLERQLQKNVSGARLFAFYDAQVFALHARKLRPYLKRVNNHLIEMVIPGEERSKSSSVLNRIQALLLAERISRADFILAVGGGVTSDLVGYAAATTLRGIPWGIISTTLLGMVDAAIGGKTGINHRLGKNLIGAFWQPGVVLCDTYFLNTLPARQMVAGSGEIVKYGGLIGREMLDPLASYLSGGDPYEKRRLTRLIRHAVEYKGSLVARDERDTGKRMLLNLGHTFAHGIEYSVGYGRLLHGEAVLLGLWAAVELSCLLKPDRARNLSAYRDCIEGLMQSVPKRKIDLKRVIEAMKLDKKRHHRQRFVLLERPGRPFIADDVTQKLIRKALERMLERYQLKGGRRV